MGGPLDKVGLELLLGEWGDLGGDWGVGVFLESSSSFLINEVISNPLNGFCCSVVLVGDINLLCESWTGLLAGDWISRTIRQNE